VTTVALKRLVWLMSDFLAAAGHRIHIVANIPMEAAAIIIAVAHPK
jgi:hypothetical protein